MSTDRSLTMSIGLFQSLSSRLLCAYLEAVADRTKTGSVFR
jgi:hypothetical protein